MLTLEKLQELIQLVTFHGWVFVVNRMGSGFYLQVHFKVNGQIQRGRKWYISKHSTWSEVVQTALKSVITALEHEARETFLYDGQAIFQPHFDVDALKELAEGKRIEKRA